MTLRSVVAGAADGDTVDLGALECSMLTLESGEIEIDVDNLAIVGPGRDALTIDGANNGRIFHHRGTGTLTVRALTLAHGLANAGRVADSVLDGSGGCILSAHLGGNGWPDGGGEGGVTLIDATVTGCIARNDEMPVFGGAIAAVGTIALHNSIVSDSRLTTHGIPSAGGAASAPGTAA